MMTALKSIYHAPLFFLPILLGLLWASNMSAQKNVPMTSEQQQLYDEIVQMDSTFFNAYNTCDMETQQEIISEDLEFYHDQGGLTTSKQEILDALKKNICGKVTRELVKGSIEVHPIPGYGAVQMGMHKFHNKEEPDAISKASKFVTIWQRQGDHWHITRIISLH